MNKVEILAPAGSKEALLSAINNGTDAIYFGGMNFGARHYANNFTNEEIIAAINYAHRFGVLVYVTVNTLIKDSEFNDAIEYVKFLYESNVDAIIIQDLGLLRVVHSLFPGLVIHASTQMNVHSVSQAKTLVSFGVKRIVLARETPPTVIKEIAEIEGLEVEVFVHGALCVSYSGNCYFSSLLGNRSGNRGRCAQPCRMLYHLDDDSNSEYLLSTKDLMTIDYLNEIINLGVKSLKIEGRMKRPEYVGLVVKSYKDAINGYIKRDTKKNLALMFNREFTKGFINDESNANITNIKSPNHIGLEIGKVIKVNNNYVYIKLNDYLNNNDSIRILSSKMDAVTINGININGNMYKNANPGDEVKIRTHHQVDVNSVVLKTTDSKLIEYINSAKKKIPITGILSLQDNYLVLKVSDGLNYICTTSNMEVQPSQNETFVDRIVAQINKTSNTDYYFETIDVNIKNIFLPIKAINELRRQAITLLDEKRSGKASPVYGTYKKFHHQENSQLRLFVKVANENQLQQVLASGITDIIVEKKSVIKISPKRCKYIFR